MKHQKLVQFGGEMHNLKVHSIFQSIDGEVNGASQGALTVFVRFSQCNLRCQYPCDTEYSFDSSKAIEMIPEEVVEEIEKYGINKVTITGGEPLLQMDGLLKLLELLQAKAYYVSIETNGSIVWGKVLGFLGSLIVDYKLESSGMTKKMLPISYFHFLRSSDFIKFVIMDRNDFNQALEFYQELTRQYIPNCHFAFAPVHGKLDPVVLLDWIKEGRIKKSVLNVQLHKILGLVEDK